MYHYFPLYIPCQGKLFLIVGGGKIALRRLRVLARFSFRIKLVATIISPEIKALAANSKYENIELCERPFRPSDLEGVNYVLAATSDHDLQTEIAKLCHDREIPCSVASDKKLCSFYFPGLILKDDFVVSVSSQGQSPAATKELLLYLRQALEEKHDQD
ncbi:MAG TPA: bifunctional precorrin-2 dehydrogenase/sirohydrochlorin ferrochelatase [Clostridiaceae bacterium]|nr:bifunctional precorrin-2 dehydrogenase/sirohydrochlorin ferrochelatase [Clostridiaceae bacterium]